MIGTPLAPFDAATRAPRAEPVRRWSTTQVAVAAVLFLGVGILTFPAAAGWFSDLAHARDLSGYATSVRDTPRTELDVIREQARVYNGDLPDGPLRDPYVLTAAGGADDLDQGDGREAYLRQLSVTAGAPMARLRIPEIDVDLPVWHGTSDSALERGVGHLYGSALPVGGAGSHAVLAGHSGLPQATLFTRLDELDDGDLFYIDVAGETLAYRIDRRTVVRPDDGDELRRVAGRDLVTLLTCTPTGVNTHRLLVRGERVEVGREDDVVQALGAVDAPPQLPWWILPLAGGLAISLVVAFPRPVLLPVEPRGDPPEGRRQHPQF